MKSIERMESNGQTAAAAAGSNIQEPSWEYQLRKYLMLLATLVATATYAAGFGPPGGVWQDNKDGANGHKAGDPILYYTPRYLAFFYFNATAFAASLVVNLLLLVLNEKRPAWLAVLRLVMVLDLLSLMGAYATGSCRDVPTTIYASVLVVALAAYVGVQIRLASGASSAKAAESYHMLKEQRKELLLLATFATGISYAAGLSPPGGFRDDGHHPGDPTLKAGQAPRLLAFFYCNTASFVASLLVIVLLLSRTLQRYYAKAQLYGFILLALFGLLGAYAAGSTRAADTTAYVVALAVAVPAYIFLVMVVMVLATDPAAACSTSWERLKFISAFTSKWLRDRGCQGSDQQSQTDGDGPPRARELLPVSNGEHGSNMDQPVNTGSMNEGIEKAKSLILLLATLAATITYQAGLDPPGGVWPTGDNAGHPILLTKQPERYKVFFYCNSTAFVASLVVILMVKSRSLIRRHTLEVAMLLDLFGLVGAYAAGSCRDVSTSIYVLALGGAVLVYVVIHVVFFTLDHDDMGEEVKKRLEKRRKRLLLLAILVATITYQAGLTPPGGFWQDKEGGNAGSPILNDGDYGRRYQAFFYCNSTSFIASVALIIMLVNPNLYRPGIRCYALYVCMVVALFGLMGAYAAGSARLLRTSIYVFVLIGAVIAFIVMQLLVFFFIPIDGDANGAESSRPRPGNTANESSSIPDPEPEVGSRRDTGESSRRKYLMLLAILAASVTYQAGLKPPGSVWQKSHESQDGVPLIEGYPVMHDIERNRYHAFFYSNSTSFVASVVVIVLLLQQSLQKNQGALLYAMNTAIVLDLLGLLAAYAAGSSREWVTSGYVIALVAAVLGIHFVLWFLAGRRREKVNSTNSQLPAQQKEQGVDHPPCDEA